MRREDLSVLGGKIVVRGHGPWPLQPGRPADRPTGRPGAREGAEGEAIGVPGIDAAQDKRELVLAVGELQAQAKTGVRPFC